ncbi:RNase adapter RapZ [Georgenia sp. 311]|uniref:RNase adapter RapZ n=1 Tax=Georgenia wutianyii TaxID=2585135 RepID=A0ABX5VNR3_9MICO|nr:MULTISPECIES: RNase adapter RapZ [Georgenia]QDB79316.1 RNase adapter RapZ [Georgenia wutianyii]TNC17396.1 RNase adapter RapZ [Georgenia sp. 311]
MTSAGADAVARGLPEDQGPPTVPEGIPALDESTPPPEVDRRELLIITGMSGAGRTRVANTLEDMDWFVVDNLPPRMLEPLARMMSASDSGVKRLAAVVDVRSGEFFAELVNILDELRRHGTDYRILFLEADDAELVRRYEQVRRAHPLQGDGRILDGIARERELLAELRRRADTIIDTTSFSPYDLARHIRQRLGEDAAQPVQITLVSFGFKHGLPLDADHVVDVRFLSNPYWVTELRHLSGKDEAVNRYVLDQPGAEEFVDNYVKTLLPAIAGYERELKHYVTIAVGCTGGRHRSVAISEAIAEGLRSNGLRVRTLHRDVGRE